MRLALAHLLQTIGEAARRVSREYQEAYPEVPWGGIVGMRHKVVHDYMDVDEDVAWRRPSRRFHGSSPFSSRSRNAERARLTTALSAPG